MEFIEMRCKSCGASLNMDLNTHMFECKYCGTVNMIDAEHVVINKHIDGAPLDLEHEYNMKMNNAEYLMNELKNYEKAYEMFAELYNTSKYDCRLLENLMFSVSYNFDHTKVMNKWLLFYDTYMNYLEAYSKIQKDPVKVSFYQHKFDMMQKKVAGNHNSTLFLVVAFVIVALLGFLLIF